MKIDIRDGIPPEIALECVKQVVKEGKVSHDTKGKAYYCWATTFTTDVGEVLVITRQYRKGDCFLVQHVYPFKEEDLKKYTEKL